MTGLKSGVSYTVEGRDRQATGSSGFVHVACRSAGRLLPPGLAAGAALLFTLTAFGQTFSDRTEGRVDAEGLSIGVFADLADAQKAGLEATTYAPTGDTVYLPVEPPPTAPTLGGAPGSLTAGDPAFLHDPRVAPRPTLFNGVLYASNNPGAYNTLLITATDVPETDEGCAAAEVQGRSGSIIVQLAPTRDGRHQAFVRILDPGTPEDHAPGGGPSCADYAGGVAHERTAAIAAGHGSTVSVRGPGAGQVSIEIDGEGPEFSYVTPEDRRGAHQGRITFEVRDRGSGLRHDGELAVTADGDYKPVNADGDNETFGEPLTVAAGGVLQRNGRAADIDLHVVVGTDADAPDITDTGDWEMLEGRPGVGYFFSADVHFPDAGRHVLGMRAVDRVGNVTRTGALHDDEAPSVVAAWTGIAFDRGQDREVADRSWIMLDFGEPVRGSGALGTAMQSADHRVVEVVHPHASRTEAAPVAHLIAPPSEPSGGEVDARSRIYVRLARPLRADETPVFILAGGAVRDVAGNANELQVVGPEDGIAPGFTVRVTAVEEGVDPDFTTHAVAGSTGGRPLVDGKGSFVVDVMADEELAARPAVYFAGVRTAQSGGSYAYSAEEVREAKAPFRHDLEQHWRRTYTAAELGGFDGLFALVVVGEDERGNTGATPGWTPGRHRGAGPPAPGNPLDLKAMDKARQLLELDRRFNGGATPDEQVTFRRHDDDASETDLFVRLSFPEEAREYERGDFRDSHPTVTITEITLDGKDAMPLLTRLSGAVFELLAHNPGESRHDVEYTAADEAGNQRSFEVPVRPLGAGEPPYKVPLHPGWNLVSLPGTPARPALGDVVPSSGLVTPVLSYQQGDWVTAVLDDGVWRGRLEEVAAGYGYWMFSIAHETIAVDIPEQERRETLPTVPVGHGWNLLGVMDLSRNPQGEPPGPKDGRGGEADRYFASIPWRMAYTFDTPRNRWVRLTPGGDEAGTAGHAAAPPIVNGRGYWVWSEGPSTLVP